MNFERQLANFRLYLQKGFDLGQQFFAALRPFEAGQRSWYFLLIGASLLSTLMIWQNAAYTFSDTSLQQVWQAQQQTFSVFHYVLKPFAWFGEWGLWLWLAIVHAYIALAFAWIGERIGIGRQSLFVLLLLLNFNLEYNDARLEISAQWLYVCCWLTAVVLFLALQEYALQRAFVAWAIWMWLGALFSPQAIIWALGFPLFFLAWPRSEAWHWRRLFGDREKFLTLYYGLIFILIMLVPAWRETMLGVLRVMQWQFSRATLEISLYMTAEQGMNLGLVSALLIAMLLIAYKALLIVGLPLIALLYLSRQTHAASVLNGRVRLFFWFALCFFWLMNALSLLYQGRISSDLHYIPLLLLLLWLASNGAYGLVQRWHKPSRRPEHRLIALWLLVAYALASLIHFAPSLGHRREAGLFALAQQAPLIIGNNSQALFYAGYSPLPASSDYLSFDILKHNPRAYLGEQGLYLFALSRHAANPPELENFHILAEFRNQRGDRSFVLQAK